MVAAQARGTQQQFPPWMGMRIRPSPGELSRLVPGST